MSFIKNLYTISKISYLIGSREIAINDNDEIVKGIIENDILKYIQDSISTYSRDTIIKIYDLINSKG